MINKRNGQEIQQNMFVDKGFQSVLWVAEASSRGEIVAKKNIKNPEPEPVNIFSGSWSRSR